MTTAQSFLPQELSCAVWSEQFHPWQSTCFRAPALTLLKSVELYAAVWRQAELHALIHIPLGKGFSVVHCEEAAWTYQSLLTDLSSYFSCCFYWAILEASPAAITLITVSRRNIQKSFWLYSNMTRKNTPRSSYRRGGWVSHQLMGEQKESLVPLGQSPWQSLAVSLGLCQAKAGVHHLLPHPFFTYHSRTKWLASRFWMAVNSLNQDRIMTCQVDHSSLAHCFGC